MKLRPIKLGQVIITPKMLLALAGAFLILGMGIGASVASPNSSFLILFLCSVISLSIIVYTFSKAK